MKKTIAVCASVTFYKELLSVEKQLKQLGFRVRLPATVKRMNKLKNFDVEKHKTWYRNPKDYQKKKKFIKAHFSEIEKADIILVFNLEKKGIKGYIGGNTLMEMALAFHLNKKIFIYNQIEKGANFEEEIFGMFPIFLRGDFSKLKF